MRASVLIAAAVFAAAPARAAAPSAGEFLSKEIRSGNGLIELGGLAAKKGARADVRRFGDALGSDAANTRALDAGRAEALGVKIPAEPDDDSKKQLKTLGELDGRAFDQAFARFVLYDRRRDLDRLEATAGSGARPVADLARAELPDARRNLAKAKALDRTVGNE